MNHAEFLLQAPDGGSQDGARLRPGPGEFLAGTSLSLKVCSVGSVLW